MTDPAPREKLGKETLKLTFIGDTSHLTTSELVKLSQAIDRLLRSPETEVTGHSPRIKWIITKMEKDD